MDTDEDLTLAEQKTLDRYAKTQDRIIRDMGYGFTDGALRLAKDNLETLKVGLEKSLERITKDSHGNDPLRDLVRLTQDLDLHVLALSVLQNAFHSVASGKHLRATLELIGRGIYWECFGAGLLKHNPKLSSRIVKSVSKKHGSVKYRRQAAKGTAKRLGFENKTWDKPLLLLAGSWALGVLLEVLPHVFVLEHQREDESTLTILPEALEQVQAGIVEGALARPYYLILDTPPIPWTGWDTGGYPEGYAFGRDATFLRTHEKPTVAAIKHAARTGTLKPTLDAVNALQAVPWAINKTVLEIQKFLYANGVDVGDSLPRKSDHPIPEKPKAWEDMTPEEQAAWKKQAHELSVINRALIGQRILLQEDWASADRGLEVGRFWTPVNCDWRGRVYPIPHFNFQREDRVRALFLFADGQPIGDEGIYWLKVHVANTCEFDGVHKRPFADRVKWVDEHLFIIRAVANAPTTEGLKWWTKADKPFLFLAACIELNRALNEGPTMITRLPVSFDGTCSGLQHLCAMTRAPEGSLVNLVPSDEKADVYGVVADKVHHRVSAEADRGEELAKRCLNYGINRSIVKRNVMTYSYSSKPFGMAQQQKEDLMDKLRQEVAVGNLEEHPFGEDNGRKAARYLAKHVYDAIQETVSLPAQAMGFLQACTRALAHEGKPLVWTTTTGLPWQNRYHEPEVKRVRLWLHDREVRVSVAVGSSPTVLKTRAVNGVSPNLVHACDADHLKHTVNAAVAEGITQIATVHDSFGCLPCHAGRFNEIIREQFVRMYQEHDVLREILDSAKHDLTEANHNRLPELPTYGTLDITSVLKSQFAFS